MKSRIALYAVIALVAVFVVSGCTTAPKKVTERVTGIKTRVDTLEARVEGVESKQVDVERMTAEQARALDEMRSQQAMADAMAKSNVTVKDRTGSPATVSAKVVDIQRCLKNAGFYAGKIDGVKGKQTRQAIRDFQQAHGLKADGVVGPRTWGMLSKYKQGASAASGDDEGAYIK